MSAADKIAGPQPPAIPPALRTRMQLPKAGSGRADVATLRNLSGPADRGLLQLNFQRLAAEGTRDLLRIEAEYGSAAAFAFGALLESGITTPETLIAYGEKLDDLYDAMTSSPLPRRPQSAEEWLQTIERGRKALKPWVYSPVKHRLAYVVRKFTDPQYEKVSGDCMDMVLLNTYLFLRAGIPAGMQADFEHVDSLVEIKSRPFLYRSSEIRPREGDENCDHLRAYLPRPRRIQRNWLGVIAGTILDKAVAALKEEAGELEQRGRFHSQIGMFTKAEQLYRRAEALDPTNPEICGGLGLIAAARGETQSALLQLAASIELGTGDPAVFQAFQGLTPPSA